MTHSIRPVRILIVLTAALILAPSWSAPALRAQQPPARPLPAPKPSPAPSPAPVMVDAWVYGNTRAVDRSMFALRDGQWSRVDGLTGALNELAFMAPMPSFPSELLGALTGATRQNIGVDDSRVSSRPPDAWLQDDPADSLYREARRALSSDSYRNAADLFRRIRNQYPKSVYTPDAPYWEAFALQRLGSEIDLRAAQEALTWQQKQFPKAATRGDASVLSTRIDGALARRGDQSAQRELLGLVGRSNSSGCARDEEDERVQALNALSRMDSAQFLPMLKKVFTRRESCTQALRRTAVWLYARSKATDAPQVLMGVAKTDPDKNVREQAVFWMANVPTDEAVNMLAELARNGSDIDLRKRAVYALSRSRSPRAAATIREIAADANAPSELRTESLQWYMSGPGRQSDDAMAFLKDVYGKADEQRFRERVLQLIGNRKSDDARDFLVSVAQNSREGLDTRRSAMSALQSSGVMASQLSAIYDRANTDLEIRKMAIGALATLRDGSGIDKLLDVARNEKNLELRKQAVGYLSRTSDPRAISLLQEIILR